MICKLLCLIARSKIEIVLVFRFVHIKLIELARLTENFKRCAIRDRVAPHFLQGGAAA